MRRDEAQLIVVEFDIPPYETPAVSGRPVLTGRNSGLRPRRADTPRDPAGVGDVVERICVEDDEVGALAGGDRAGIGHPQELGGIARRRDDDLHRRHPRRDHVRHLEMRAPGRVAVGAERDADAGRAQLRQVARLDAERRLRLRPIGGARLKLLELRVRKAVAQPAQVGLDAAIGKVRARRPRSAAS